jgi:hypothetical protein
VRTPDLVPVHVGHLNPAPTANAPRPVLLGPERWGAGSTPKTPQQSLLTDAEVDWERHGLEPRWIGLEAADCAAALQPNVSNIKGSPELGRFLAGAAGRGETALVVSMLGHADATGHPLTTLGGDTIYLPGLGTAISCRPLPAGTRPTIAENLNLADRDLGLRLRNRPSPAPWWTQHFSSIGIEGPTGTPRTLAPEGKLQPILVDALGAPVVSVWVSPDGQQRWYLIPDMVDWNTVLDWLIQQALPAYAPTVLRRLRTTSSIDPDLQTPTEAAARQALVDLEDRYAEERTRLEAELARAKQEADPVRYGLIFGTGAILVDAVAIVLTDAGFTTTNLDQELGETRSADLLAMLGLHSRLVEVKAASGSASENLVADLQRHLDTWPHLEPKTPVGGGALVVNHQHKLPPAQRARQVYTRPEFTKALTVPVIATRDLFDWWKESDWPAIQRTLLGTTPPTGEIETSTPLGRTAVPPSPSAEPRSWFRRRRREQLS